MGTSNAPNLPSKGPSSIRKSGRNLLKSLDMGDYEPSLCCGDLGRTLRPTWPPSRPRSQTYGPKPTAISVFITLLARLSSSLKHPLATATMLYRGDFVHTVQLSDLTICHDYLLGKCSVSLSRTPNDLVFQLLTLRAISPILSKRRLRFPALSSRTRATILFLYLQAVSFFRPSVTSTSTLRNSFTKEQAYIFL